MQKDGLRAFGAAMFAHWFTAMSGPLSVPVALAAFFVENPTAKVLLGLTAFICVWAASYSMWKVERDRANLAAQEVERLKSIVPRLSATIEGIVFGGRDERLPDIAPLILIISIRNIGSMQSIASEFQIALSRDGAVKNAQLMAIKGPVTLGFPIPGQPGKENFMRYNESEALYRKANVPIQVGAKISGLLVASISIADKDWLSPGTEITVLFKDILGAGHETKRNLTGGDLSDLQDFAGLEGTIANDKP